MDDRYVAGALAAGITVTYTLCGSILVGKFRCQYKQVWSKIIGREHRAQTQQQYLKKSYDVYIRRARSHRKS